MAADDSPDPSGAEPKAPSPGDGEGRPGADRAAERPVEPVDDLVASRHRLQTPDGALEYEVSAGRVVLREEKHEDGTFRGHQAKAELFLAAYTAVGAQPAVRPVVFAFNGGPGSSSAWLHLGVLGPRRVLMGDAGGLLPPPYGLVDNPETLLRHADLVFIDPISTGYSRVVRGEKPEDFHGYRRDLEAVGELIRLWTSRGGRWLSPKYIAGESYGTLRAGALADHLQARYGLYLNGLALISSVLDMGTIRFTEGNDAATALYLPTYASVAAYHGVLGDRPVAEIRAEAEELAAGDYPRALALGDRLPAAERTGLVGRLSRVTGLSPRWLEAANLRIESQRFFAELLRDRGQVVGRLDGRFTGWEADGAHERPEADPSYTAIHGPYAAALNHYVREELGYANDLPYEVLTDRVQPWSYREFEGRHVTVADRMAAAIRHNPHLRVLVACGYHDGATPYFAAQHTVAHLHLPPELRGNVRLRYYEAGHMMYVHEPSRLRLSEDLAGFVAGR